MTLNKQYKKGSEELKPELDKEDLELNALAEGIDELLEVIERKQEEENE